MTISLTTVYHYIRHLKDFFKWLAYQSGYKSRISLTDVEYLKLSKEKVRIALSTKREQYPSLQEIKQVINSIAIQNEIDMRDKALIVFTLLSGMRDAAIISLPLGAFEEDTLKVNQNPKLGAKTKFSKTIHSYLFRFDDGLLEAIQDWVKYLKQQKNFQDDDPLFPHNKIHNAPNQKRFISDSVEPLYWQSVTSMRTIFKQRFKAAGIEYFSPHTLRHLAVRLATEKCRNGQELKAVSQNFGHENVGTTMTVYGTINNLDMGSIISGMKWGDDTSSLSDYEQFKKFQEFMKQDNQGNF